ncbi:MAG: Kazal-type serine protease inhibitor [Bacteroidales bacterium]
MKNRALSFLALFLYLCINSVQGQISNNNPCMGTPKENCVCPAIYNPVLGCDGKVYGNECEARCNGILRVGNEMIDIVGKTTIALGETTTLVSSIPFQNTPNNPYTVIWLAGGQRVGDGLSLTVKPQKTTTYTVIFNITVYNEGKPMKFELSKDVTVTVNNSGGNDECIVLPAPKVIGFTNKGVFAITEKQLKPSVTEWEIRDANGAVVKYNKIEKDTLKVWNGLVGGQKYTVQVRYYNDNNKCEYSKPTYFSTSPKPLKIKVLQAGNNSVSIENPNMGELFRYIVKNANGKVILRSDFTTQKNYTFKSNLLVPGAYKVGVRIKNGAMVSNIVGVTDFTIK